jgi:hypothetical protein
MRDEIEQTLLNISVRFRNKLNCYDRIVVVGFALSINPIFPSCVIGLLLSLLNWFILSDTAQSKPDKRLIKISVVVGVALSTFWVFLLFKSWELLVRYFYTQSVHLFDSAFVIGNLV